MNGDNVSETFSIISPALCNGCENTKNSLDNKSYSLLKYNQITTAQNELISIQRSLIRELLKNSKEFQERFGNNYDTKNSNQHEQQTTNKGGVECDAMHVDVESIRDEICFVKSFRDLVKDKEKGSNGKEKVENMKFGNGTSIKNYTFNQIQHDESTGFVYSGSGSSQNHFFPPQIKDNNNFINLTNSPNLYKEVAEGGSSTRVNGASLTNEYPMSRNDFISFGQNDNLQSTTTSDYQGNHNETNEINEDFFGEYKGFNSIYVGIGKENIDIHQLKQCLEENFGHVRFIRIIRNKNCAFAEFEEKQCFSDAIESGHVSLNGVNLKINKTFRKKKEN
ncbi:hypothetical protein GLOIN_2v1766994 [Rhizophagus clarus]|nr:hypothetical protein GLOIN_2v1766994 [Rhizophagus clarus]